MWSVKDVTNSVNVYINSVNLLKTIILFLFIFFNSVTKKKNNV